MLKSWSIKNFKPIVDSGELQFAPVTVLAGRNSSGKSSLLQSILMIAQTLGSKLLDRPLITNGSFVQLGTFEDIVSELSSLKHMQIAFTLMPSEVEKVLPELIDVSIKSIQVSIRFIGQNVDSIVKSAIESSKVLVDMICIEVAFDSIDPILKDIQEFYEEEVGIYFLARRMAQTELNTDDFFKDVIPDHLYLAHDTISNYLGDFQSALNGFSEHHTLVKLSHFLPFRYIRKFNIARRYEEQMTGLVHDLFMVDDVIYKYIIKSIKDFDLETLVSHELKQDILEFCKIRNVFEVFSGQTIRDLADWYRALKEIPRGKKARIGRRLGEIVVRNLITDKQGDRINQWKDAQDLEEIPKNLAYSTFEQIVNQVAGFFTGYIRYLGPLRADPGTIQQQFSPTGELDNVGIKGEYAAIVYYTNKNALIDWYNPQTRKVEMGTLQIALDTWAHYLNIAEHIGIAEAGVIGITWQIIAKEGMKPRSLPEVGVGISQILPILVMGLLSPAHCLLIIEQPELHLHPYVQARLGDFFVGLAKCKKQCLIETHSENLVSQLRLHIVQAGGLEKSDCMVYFVDQDEQGAAKFEKIEISPNGNILNWPEGFFDESMLQEDRITAASLRKRAHEAKHDG